MNEVVQYQRQLEKERAAKERMEQSERENWKQRKDLENLKDQVKYYFVVEAYFQNEL